MAHTHSCHLSRVQLIFVFVYIWKRSTMLTGTLFRIMLRKQPLNTSAQTFHCRQQDQGLTIRKVLDTCGKSPISRRYISGAAEEGHRGCYMNQGASQDPLSPGCIRFLQSNATHQLSRADIERSYQQNDQQFLF